MKLFQFLSLITLMLIAPFHLKAQSSFNEIDALYDQAKSISYLPQSINKAFLLIDSAYQKSLRLNYCSGIARADYMKGKIFLLQRTEFSKAYKSFNNALNKYTECNDANGKGLALLQLGVILYNQKYCSDAIPFFERSNREFIISKDERRQAMTSYLIGLCKIEINNSKDAKDFLIRAYNMYNKVQDKHGMAECNYGLGKMYNELALADSAFFHLTESETQLILENDTQALATVYAELSRAYYLNNELSIAEKIAQKSVKYSAFEDNKIARMQALKTLHQIYFSKGNISNAYLYFNRFINLKDSLQNEAKMIEIGNLKEEFKLEHQQKENEITNLKNEAIKNAQVQKQKTIKWLAIVAAVFLLILLIIGSNFYRSSNKKKAELQKSLDTLEKTQQRLIHQEKLASLGMITEGIAHEIKNPLNFVTNFSATSLDLIEDIEKSLIEAEKKYLLEYVKKNLEKINDHSKRADLVVKNIMDHAQPISTEPTRCNINQMLMDSCNIIVNRSSENKSEDKIQLKFNLDESLPKIFSIQQNINRVLISILNNSVYSLKEKVKKSDAAFLPQITLITHHDRDWIYITIRDNGFGVSPENKSKIFSPFFTTKPQGQGAGLGLNIAHDIVVKDLNGKMSFESEPNMGFAMNIVLPIQ